MDKSKRDRSLDTLLDLNGQVFVIDPAGGCWVKFRVTMIEPSPEKPHGLDYSLTLHDMKGDRLVGFDNAHPVSLTRGPGKRKGKKQDHKHRLRTIRPYEYQDAATLLEDFWAEVDSVLKEKGIRI